MNKKLAAYIGMGLGVLIILVAIVAFIMGVWTGDDRWHQTGGVLVALGFVLFFGSGIAGI